MVELPEMLPSWGYCRRGCLHAERRLPYSASIEIHLWYLLLLNRGLDNLVVVIN